MEGHLHFYFSHVEYICLTIYLLSKSSKAQLANLCSSIPILRSFHCQPLLGSQKRQSHALKAPFASSATTQDTHRWQMPLLVTVCSAPIHTVLPFHFFDPVLPDPEGIEAF